MNVIIIEDEELTSENLSALIKQYDSSIRVVAVLASVAESIFWLEENNASNAMEIDLIFMDIHLEDGDSFQIIKALNLKTPIIFITAFDDYMIKAFKVNSIDYLLKPINFEELTAAIDKFKGLKQMLSAPLNGLEQIKDLLSSFSGGRPTEYRTRFMVTLGTKIKTIKTSSIAYFQLEASTVFIITREHTKHPIDFSLDKVNQMLDPKEFFRVNRQFIVALDSITLIHSYSAGKLRIDLRPQPEVEVFVSGDRITEFKEWLGK